MLNSAEMRAGASAACAPMSGLAGGRRDESGLRRLHAIGSEHPPASASQPTIIERDFELETRDGAVTRLIDGRGGVVVLEAAAGMGKTVLLDRAAAPAAQAGCLIRRAAPGPLERRFPFGVVRTLLEAPLRGAPEHVRSELLSGPAATAARLLLEGALPGETHTMMLAHSVLWLSTAIAAEQPVLLVVDDAQWADRVSLEVLSYLARRIDELPVLIAIAARAEQPRGSVRSSEPARRSPLRDGSVSCAADADRCRAPDPRGGARDADRAVPRLASRGRGPPVAARRARSRARRARGRDRRAP